MSRVVKSIIEVEDFLKKNPSLESLSVFLSKYEKLSPTQKGLVFEYVANPDTNGCSEWVDIVELENIHRSFHTGGNGCDWARSDEGRLGHKYNIIRARAGIRVGKIRLDGFNESNKRFRTIRSDIAKKYRNAICPVLWHSHDIEIDHKDGRYEVESNKSTATQKFEDFQGLSKSANDSKREFCKKCKASGLRPDARMVGYKVGWTHGTEKFDKCNGGCLGCYWYDPFKFNQEISANF